MKCEDCKWFIPHDGNIYHFSQAGFWSVADKGKPSKDFKWGYCHFNPPDACSHFPGVFANNFCGQFKEKSGVIEDITQSAPEIDKTLIKEKPIWEAE